jgi:phosphohistidine swiveling domain-containing protein
MVFMSLIKLFSELDKNEAPIAGGKGASLGEMTNAGIPVPPGFVVLSTTFDRFLAETDLLQEIEATLSTVNHQEIHTVEHASETIQSLIKRATMPQDIATDIVQYFKELDAEYVAVRSSATAEDGAENAWAGQLDSFLNTTEDTLLENVQRCWASLFTPRAIFYRFELMNRTHTDSTRTDTDSMRTHAGLEKISVAVVVQKMIQSEVSGIAFSVHPITEDRNQLIIEAGFGLGEAIVSGSITPDSYVVEKEPRKIIDKNIATQERGIYRISSSSARGEVAKGRRGGSEWQPIDPAKQSQQKLSDDQILELSELILKIENHYNFPCDIEWAYEGGKFYIVQSRPITTLSKQGNKTSKQFINNPDQYQRLFQVGGMPYLVSDAFMDEYRKLDGLAICADGIWTTFLPKKSIKNTLTEGLMLYSNKKKFREYGGGFEAYKLETSKLFEELSHKGELTKSEASRFFRSLTRLFHYYRRTEFFATDEAYQYSLSDETTRQNLKQFEYIKNSGREYLNKLFFGSGSYLTKILGILTNQFDITDEDLRLYSKKDILSLFDGTRISESILKNRKSAYVMIGGKTLTCIEGEEAGLIVARFNMALHEFHQEFKGQIANKGIVRGRAKVIIADYGNFDGLKNIMESMSKGDILIAETTSPELMPACSRASAIVTNQGGMMSHAAIVSREMEIPCIVGTGNATDLVKDGDLVEVDADNGVVRILEK